MPSGLFAIRSNWTRVVGRYGLINIAGIAIVLCIYFLAGRNTESGLWNWGYLATTVGVFIAAAMVTSDLFAGASSLAVRLPAMLVGGLVATGLFVIVSLLLVVNVHELFGGGL